MKSTLRTILMIALIFTMTACNKEDKKDTSNEPGKTITIIEGSEQEGIKPEDNKSEEDKQKEDKEKEDRPEGNRPEEDKQIEVKPEGDKTEEDKPEISVEKIDRYEQVNITDWLDEDTVIVSKENDALDKMKLAELSAYYPRSLYLLDIITQDYKLIKEQKQTFLEGAIFSKDKKYLLYYEYDLGDPAFFVMNMDTLEGFGILGDLIGGGISAKWADNNTVIGAAYSGGAYLADRTGRITLVDGLKEDALYLIEKVGDSIYYNTQYDGTLMKLDLNTKEKVNLNLTQVYNIIPSPDGKQMLILQVEDTKNTMLVFDLESGEKINIADGTELNGVSWSPNQRLIAYCLKDDKNNTTTNSIYIYDMLAGKATQIEDDINSASTRWSPSGEMLTYTEWDGTYYHSSIAYLK